MCKGNFSQINFLMQCIRAPPRRGRYWEISRAEGMDFPIPPEFWWSTDILLIINPSTGMDQEIHPSRQGRIDSVKINASPLRMREWLILASLKSWVIYILHNCRSNAVRLCTESSIPKMDMSKFDGRGNTGRWNRELEIAFCIFYFALYE